MIEQYMIEGTSNRCVRELYGMEYNNPKYYPQFQDKVVWYKNLLKQKYNKGESLTLLRVGDGEYRFLQGHRLGNIHANFSSNKELSPSFIQKFKDGCIANDIVSPSMYLDQAKTYGRLFPNKPSALPLEIVYALFANKWYFNEFKEGGIGLIGGAEKIKVVQELMKHEEYRNYIGLSEFNDYILTPERFGCDDPERLLEDIGGHLKNSTSKFFIYGMGLVKMAIAHKFPDYKKGIYIDVGCGLTALAGTTSLERPFFGDWINYRLKNYDYSRMDPADYKDTADINTIFLE